MTLQPNKDQQTVTTDGKRIQTLPEGVHLHAAMTQTDERGTVCEVFNPAWGFSDLPLVYIYEFTVRPRKIKGWVVHRKQEDRIFLSRGTVKIVLYDDRINSSTYQQISIVHLSEYHRALINYPAGVYHAIQNVGDKTALLLNMPTQPYNHADPDKYRLPLNTDQIPYRFDTNGAGW
jgi:dTDP-4-dehydrorhamnose 3,5-epimerase